MHAFISSGRQWLKNQFVFNSHVKATALRYNLLRFRTLCCVALVVNCGYMYGFWVLDQRNSNPASQQWANAIGWCHLLMALASIGFGLGMHYLLKTGRTYSRAALAVLLLYVGCALAFGIALSVADQLVMNSTTNYAILTLTIMVAAIWPPAWSVPVFLLSFLAHFFALTLTITDPEMLILARSQSLAPPIIGIVASMYFWHQFFREVMLRRQLVQTNKELAVRQQELEHLAAYDSLTGLYLRRKFNLLASLELARAARSQLPTCLLIVDLDHFKKVNDVHGHPVGDEVLRQVAQHLLSGVRCTDIVGRLGGEEFIILLSGTGAERALNVAEKLRQKIAGTPVKIHNGTTLTVTASIGVCPLGPGQTQALDVLYACADQALYQAKHKGRNRVELGSLAGS